MTALDCISYDVPLLEPQEQPETALKWMDDLKVTHLPVVKGNKLLGMISESATLDALTESGTVADLVHDLRPIHVLSHQHLFEVIKVMADGNFSVIPVLDEHGNYEGAIIAYEVLQHIAQMSIIREPGSVLVLELNARDYSMTEVANIVESDGAKILASFVTSMPESTQMELTLKINKPNLSAIIKTFERYKYVILRSFDQGDYNDNLKQRYDSLMNYLNF